MDDVCGKSSFPSKCLHPDIGSRIFLSDLIVEHIFQHLSVPDLARCSLVCQTWNRVAKRIKKKRTQLFWLYKVFPCKSKRYDGHIASPALSPVVARDELDVGKHYFEVLQSAPSEPVYGFIFSNSILFYETQSYFSLYPSQSDMRHRKRRKCLGREDIFYSLVTDTAHFLSQSLPRSNNIIACCSSGTVGTPPDNSVSVEVEKSVGLSAIFIPHIPGVRMYQFTTTFDDINKSYAPDGDKRKAEILSAIPDNENIKCLLFLSAVGPDRFRTDIVEHFLQRQNFQLAFGGAMVDALGCCNGAVDVPVITSVGLAFCGEKVSAASIILKSSIQTAEEAEKQIQRLKSANFPEENCYCFMFACCGRGVHHYGEGNVEAQAFKKVFPKVPLFGVFGNGEFGLDYIPSSTNTGPKPSLNASENWEYSYTTIFVMISLNK